MKKLSYCLLLLGMSIFVGCSKNVGIENPVERSAEIPSEDIAAIEHSSEGV